MTAAEAVAGALAEAGTRHLFGAAVAASPFLGAAARAGLTMVATGGSAAAVRMAAVTGDVTGRPGVALIPRGLGLAAAAGLAGAAADRSPLVVIGEDLDPEERACLHRMARGHVVASGPLPAGAVDVAMRATLDREGPVWLDLDAGAGPPPDATAATGVPAVAPPDPHVLDEAARWLAGAERPVIVAGPGCRSIHAASWLRAFVEARPAPVLTTLRAKGTVPEPHPLAFGVVTDAAARAALAEHADLVVTVGTDPDTGFPAWPRRETPALHLAPVRAWRGDRRIETPGGAGQAGARGDLEVMGEVALVLEELAPRLRGRSADWDLAVLDRLRRTLGARAEGPGFDAVRVVRRTREAMPAGAIAAVDGGDVLEPVSIGWQAVTPVEFLGPGPPGGTGHAIPGAVAARLGRPDVPALAFTDGAGAVGALSELATAVRLGVAVLVVVLGPAPLAAFLAREVGVHTAVARDEAELAAALGAALTRRGPVLVEAASV